MPRSRFCIVVSAALALSLAASRPVVADDFVPGLVTGLIVGGIIGSQAGKGRKTTTRSSGKRTTRSRPGISQAQREENRKIQVALTHLGCDTGTPDGAFGPKTRAAIVCFQAKMSVAQTGTLTTEERNGLLEYHKTNIAGAPTNPPPAGQVIVAGGAASIFDSLGKGGVVTASTAGQSTPDERPDVVALDANVTVDTDDSLCVSQSGPLDALPGISAPKANRLVDGIPTVGYCDLKAAISSSAEDVAAVRGVKLADLTQQCGSLIAMTAPVADRLSQFSPADAIMEVGNIIGDKIVNPSEAVQSARLCTGVGYLVEDDALVEAASLFGAASGDPSLVEVIGWNYAFGLGRDADRALAAAWLDEAAKGISEMEPSLLLLAEADRPDNLRAVVEVISGRTGAAAPLGLALPGLKN